MISHGRTFSNNVNTTVANIPLYERKFTNERSNSFFLVKDYNWIWDYNWTGLKGDSNGC
jgi:hypothetical protein